LGISIVECLVDNVAVEVALNVNKSFRSVGVFGKVPDVDLLAAEVQVVRKIGVISVTASVVTPSSTDGLSFSLPSAPVLVEQAASETVIAAAKNAANNLAVAELFIVPSKKYKIFAVALPALKNFAAFHCLIRFVAWQDISNYNIYQHLCQYITVITSQYIVCVNCNVFDLWSANFGGLHIKVLHNYHLLLTCIGIYGILSFTISFWKRSMPSMKKLLAAFVIVI
jgi:hypothetical protein